MEATSYGFRWPEIHLNKKIAIFMKIVQENRDEMPCHASDVYEYQNLSRSLKYSNFTNYTYKK